MKGIKAYHHKAGIKSQGEEGRKEQVNYKMVKKQ